MVPAERAPLHHIIPYMVHPLAGPECLSQVPVDQATIVCWYAAVEEEGAGGLEVGAGVGVEGELEAALRVHDVKPIPVDPQSVRDQCWRSVGQVEEVAGGVEELEGSGESPAYSPQGEVGRS
jgi:hypothetical protein